MPANGTTDLPSSHSVKRTIDRLIELLRPKGIKIFARIDQAQAAKEVGLSMRPTELLLFWRSAEWDATDESISLAGN